MAKWSQVHNPACGGDTEGEGKNGGQSEGGTLTEFASGEQQVGEEGVHGGLDNWTTALMGS